MPASDLPPNRSQLAIGDHTPLFACPDSDGRVFEFYSAVVGKPIVLIFTGDRDLANVASAGLDPSRLDKDLAQIATFVPGDQAVAASQKSAAPWPHRVMADLGAEITDGFAGLSGVKAPSIYVLDPNQRLVAVAALDDLGNRALSWIEENVATATFDDPPNVLQRVAPALLVPRALDPEDCKWLIRMWHDGDTDDGTVARGSSAGGGVSVVPTTKRREDFYIRDPEMHNQVAERLMSRLVPEITKVLHFEGFALETFKIGCYKAEKAGFFNPHRDDYSPDTKNRKFAVTVNLNTGEYEGGNLRFPEYGPELFCPPLGGAVVFSCSMLHEVVPVTRGHRFVLLTFLTIPPQ